MTQEQAQESAARLGLSVWEAEVVRVSTEGSETVPLMCVGFASLDLPIAEAETWDEALAEATRIIFS